MTQQHAVTPTIRPTLFIHLLFGFTRHILAAALIALVLLIRPIGYPQVTHAQDSRSATEDVRAKTVEGQRIGAAVSILDFERFGDWRRGDERWGTFTQSKEQVIGGSYVGKFAYGFPAVPNNYIVFRQRTNIPSRPDGLRIQVYGDGSTHFLNGWVKDASGTIWQFTFGRINHVGWQPMFAPLDLDLGWPNQLISGPSGRSDFVYPIQLAALVLDGHSPEQGSQGVIYVDDLEAITYASSPYFSADARPDELLGRTRELTGTTAIVTAERLNVRAEPGTSYAVTAKVTRGETLVVLARDPLSGWLQVVTDEDTGWISEQYVELTENSEEIIGSERLAIQAEPAATVTVNINDSGNITSTLVGTSTVTAARSFVAVDKPSAASDVELSDDASIDGNPTGRIAFPSYAGGQYAIFIINADGTDLRWVVGNASQPALTQDGQRVAFRNWDDNARGVGIVDTVGGEVRQISKRPEDALPAWSPDDDTLVYFSRREGDRRSRIYQASASNRNEWELEKAGGEYPMWMPDGRILYRATRPQIAVTVMDDDGENQLLLIADGEATAPAISPDGQSVLFMSRRSGNWEIYLTDTSGATPTRLTINRYNDGLPTWSPDGKHIAYVTDRDGYWAIWLMAKDGSEQRQLLRIPGELDPRMPDEPAYRFRGWQEERISWSR